MQVTMTPFRAEEECSSLKKLHSVNRRKKNIDLYDGAGTLIFEDLWLMCDTDAQSTEKGNSNGQIEFYVGIFSSRLARKYKFYFT